MGINVSLACAQTNKLNDYVTKLRTVKHNMQNYKDELNHYWKAPEMVYINNALDGINLELQRLASSLESIGDDIEKSAYEIRNEEIEKERAEAKARAEAEARG